jgi:hypothetical protein
VMHRSADGSRLLLAELREPGSMLQGFDEQMTQVDLRRGRQVSDVHQRVAMDLEPGVRCGVLVTDQARTRHAFQARSRLGHERAWFAGRACARGWGGVHTR